MVQLHNIVKVRAKIRETLRGTRKECLINIKNENKKSASHLIVAVNQVCIVKKGVKYGRDCGDMSLPLFRFPEITFFCSAIFRPAPPLSLTN